LARKTVVTLIDDITGEPFARGEGQTVNFSVHGFEYEMDLNRDNAKKFADTMAFYTTRARKIGTSRRSPVQRIPVPTSVDTAAVRAWAASRGIIVSPRGRIPASIIDQFRAAGN
jgi:hypothetical protein